MFWCSRPDEKTMQNYYTRTIEPILSAIVDEMKRKFLTKTARSRVHRDDSNTALIQHGHDNVLNERPACLVDIRLQIQACCVHRWNGACGSAKSARRQQSNEPDGIPEPLKSYFSSILNIVLLWCYSGLRFWGVLGRRAQVTVPELVDGVYAYGFFNETESGKAAKQLVQHGDVQALSIYANGLKQQPNESSCQKSQQSHPRANHQHNDPANILGHAILENRQDGVYAYGFFNESRD